MFRTKSKAEQRQERTASLVEGASSVADQLREKVVPAVGQAAGSAREWSQPHVEAAREWARPHVEHGMEVAGPKLESAVNGLAPKVDVARDKIVELLPRLTDAIAAFTAVSAAAKDEAVSRGAGAAAVIAGEAVASPKRKKKGKKRRLLFLALGLLATVAAAVTAFMKRSSIRDDPWANPLSDPYVTPASGRHSTDGPVAGADLLVDQVDEEPEIAASLDGPDEDLLDAAPDSYLAENDGKTEGPRT